MTYICQVNCFLTIYLTLTCMKKNYMLSSCLAMLALAGQADTGGTVTVGGSAVEGFVTRITFDGDNAALLFDDGRTMAADMSQVNITLSYDAEDTSISDVDAASGSTASRIYTIGGQYAGDSPEGLPKGVYIVNGKKMIIK